MPPYIWMPHMFGCPPIYLDTPYMFGFPICLDASIFLDALYIKIPPICLDALHMSECPTHICMPPYSPVYLYVSRGYLHMIWDGGIYTPHIECSDAIKRIICKKHYKFVHVGKCKTPYDLCELFTYLSEGA